MKNIRLFLAWMIAAALAVSPALAGAPAGSRTEDALACLGRELDAAMLRLPLPVRKRIEMRCVRGLTYTAIAAIEHVSESAVEQSVKSGLRRLRTAVRAGKIPLLRPEP